jgi:diketogulonate reductase-like aldo/keto reductase
MFQDPIQFAYQEARRFVNCYPAAGFSKNAFTACQPKHYEERLVGAALNRLKSQGIEREALFLQTKFTPLSGQDPENVPYDQSAPIGLQVAQSFEVSQKNLQTEYVDSLVLHSPVAPYAALMKVWHAMEKIHREGGARQLGISNCHDIELIQALHADVAVKPAVVQNRFYSRTGYDAGLRSWCTGHGVIYQSFWTLTANPHILASDAVQTMARQYGKTGPQILFRSLTQSGIVPLTGPCSEEHMRQDLAIFDFEPSHEDMAEVAALVG